VGTSLIHLVTTTGSDGAAGLRLAKTIATGPEGSSTHRLATILKDGLGLSAEVMPTESDSLADLLGVVDGGSDVVLIATSAGDRTLTERFEEGGLRLLPIEDWNTGANLVKYPFLRSVRIPANSYGLQFLPVETLASQVVLAGPAPGSEAPIGEQGPGATAAPSLKPIPTSTVRTLAGSIDDGALVDPVLRRAAAFAPELPEPPAAMNPAADISILNLLIVIVLAWLGWLYTRPEIR